MTIVKVEFIGGPLDGHKAEVVSGPDDPPAGLLRISLHTKPRSNVWNVSLYELLPGDSCGQMIYQFLPPAWQEPIEGPDEGPPAARSRQ
jgi:hypothetical protein